MRNMPSKSSSPTDLHPVTSSTDPIHSERQPVPLDPTLHQEIIHDWTEKVKEKLRSGNRTKEFLCEVRRDIGHILVLKKFDTPHERNAFIRSLVEEPSKEEELVAWLQEAEPTNPYESALEDRDPASTQSLPSVKTFLEARNEPSTTSGGSSSGASSSEPSSSSQADSFGLPSTNVPSAGILGQFNPNFSSLQFPNLQVGTGSLQFGIPVPGISVKDPPPAPAPSSVPDPLTSFLTSQRGLPGFINAQTIPIPSIPELDSKPAAPSRRSGPKPEGTKRKPGRPLGSTKMAMIQRKREDRKRAEESRLQAQQDIFPVPRSSEEQAQIEKEGSEIARGLLMANLQISMDTTVAIEVSSEYGGERTEEPAIGKEVSERETSEAQAAQPEKRVLRKRKSRAELFSPIDSISDESAPSGSAENPSTAIQPQPTTRQEKCSKIPRKTFEDNPPSISATKVMIKGFMRKDNRKARRAGKRKIEESKEPIASQDLDSVIDRVVTRAMNEKIEDIVMPPTKRRRRSTTGSTAQESEGTKNRVRKILHGTDTEIAKGGKPGRGARRNRKKSATTKTQAPEDVVVDAGQSTALDQASRESEDAVALDSRKGQEPVASSSQQIDVDVSETVIQHTSSCRVSSNDVIEKATSNDADASDNSNRIPADVAVLQTQKKPSYENSVSEDTAVMRRSSQSEDAGTANGNETAPERTQVASSKMDKFDNAPSNNATNAKESAPGQIQIAVIDTASPMEDGGAIHAEEAAPEGIQVAASTIEILHDALLKDAGASEVPKSAVVVERSQPNQEEGCEMVHETTDPTSAVILEDVSKKTDTPKTSVATHPSETEAPLVLKSPKPVSSTVPNSLCEMSPESTPRLIPDATIEALIEKIHSNQVEASETVIERLEESAKPNLQEPNTPETASFEQPSPVREIQKTVSETGVTLDVRTSEASIPQGSPVEPENLQILENQAHQDQLTDSLVEDEDPNKSDRSEAVQSEVSVSLINNSASASTEKTMPVDPISMEASTIPEASRIISSADMEARGSEEGTGEPPAGSVEQDEPSHSADQLDPDFNFARRREMERIEMERMYKEMRKKPLCQSFCRRPDDNFLTSETFQETVPDSESVNSSTASLEYQIVSQSQPVDQSSSQDVEPFTEINGQELGHELLQPELMNEMSSTMDTSENCTESTGLTSLTTTDASLMVSPNIPTTVVPPTLSGPLELFGSSITDLSHLDSTPRTSSASIPSHTSALHVKQHKDLGTVAMTSEATPQASNFMAPSSPVNSAAPIAPMQAHAPVPTRTSSDPLEPTGNGIHVDVSSSTTDPAHLDSISTTASVELLLQQVLPTPDSAPNSESRTANSTSSGAESFAALPTSTSQAARENSGPSVNQQQNDLESNAIPRTAAPEVSTSLVPNSSTSNAAPTSKTIDVSFVSTWVPPFATATSFGGIKENSQEGSSMIPSGPSASHTSSTVPHPGMLSSPTGPAPSCIKSPRAPPLHQDVPALRVSPRSFAHSVAISTQLPPDETRHPPPPYTADSQPDASHSPPINSTVPIAPLQASVPIPTRTPSKPRERLGNDLQMDTSRSSTDPAHSDSITTTSSATGLQTSTSPDARETSGLPRNQKIDLEANTMVYTAASEVPNPLFSNSSTSYAVPAVSTAVAPCASTETSSGMVPPASSVPRTTPAIPSYFHIGMFPSPPGPPRAPPHHPGVPVRKVPQGPFGHPSQFLPGTNFMNNWGAPRLNPFFAQNSMNVGNMHPGAMRHPMISPPPYTAVSQAAPFNLPPVNSTVPMAFAPMRGSALFPFPPRPEVAAQWMAAHLMPQQQNNPIVPPQKTPKRARKPRTKAAPRNDTVVSIPIAPSPPAAAPVPPIVQMIAPQPEVYQNAQASSIRRVFNTMPRSDQAASPDSSSSESMPRLEADGEEEETVREEPGPADQSSPEAPPPKNSGLDEDLSKMICRDEAIHEALKNAPRAKSRILPLEEITPSDEECPDLEFFKSFVDRSQSFGEMNRCTVTCAEMFSSEFTNLVEERGQQKRRFHKNEEFRKTLEGVKAVAMFEMVMQNNLITILNKWPEARQEPKFQLFLQAHEMTGHKAVFNNENEAEAEKNLVIRTLNYLSDLSREKNFGCNETIAILLYAVHKFVGCCYPVQGFRLIHQILQTYCSSRNDNVEFQDLD
ncbi:hypothetical protein B9Z55_003024 [Caenorhabditis nigoni]|uniref:Uncharacterized protein n=1 Tax=Caenorhabditis nigoni TaxID=1611254 RepID=A0A2G5VN28_9PELO|nr:hypothetical protein B9Z55_003024 [Caenorhabditis nigoni]